MRIEKIISAAAALLTLCSCSIFREYKRPDLPQLDSLYTLAGQSDTLNLADLSWSEFFTDPCLQSLIRTGLENNNDLQQAALKLTEAEAALKSARFAFFPTLGVKPSFAWENADRYNGDAFSYAIQPAVSWEADINGRLLNNKRIAFSDKEAAELWERSVRTELVCSIASCYYTLLMLDAQMDISTRTSQTWKENVRIMKAMKDAGMTNEASVAQTEANSCSIEASLCDLGQKILETEHTMSVLLGVASKGITRTRMSESSIESDILTGVPAQLLSRRPDVMRAEANLKKAFYNTNLAHSAFYPSLTLTGDLGWEKALTSPAGWAFGAAASMVAPIINGRRNRSNLEIAKAREAEAFSAFRQTLLVAGKEVNDALARCHNAQSKTDIRVRQIEALEKAVDSTQKLMRHSESTYLEVLTAQQSLLSAQLQQISDNYEALSGMVSLYRALGGGSK